MPTDLERGRRPGSARDYKEYTQITHYFDVFQMMSPSVEPQDIATHLRHYFTTEVQLTHTDKFPFLFSRGRAQAMDNFEMIRDFRGLSDEEFCEVPHSYTIINTNSPRTLDFPMAQGLIDFARHGQLSIVTPFTLMGAMAPITVAGALTLSHAEALAAITLVQLVNPGAPVCYGTFTSNVDMKSGAPAFGTPSHFQASLAAGQLARYIGLPWRSAAGSASNINDVQAANENQFGLWGCLMAGATIIIHSAGWLEGGLAVGYEKFVMDCDQANMIAVLLEGMDLSENAQAMDAFHEVGPGKHFLGSAHTLSNFESAFYRSTIADNNSFEQWSAEGSLDAAQRANGIWKKMLADYVPPALDPAIDEALLDFMAREKASFADRDY